MTSDLAAQLASVTSVTEMEHLRRLEEIVKSIEVPIVAQRDREALFKVFERFPEDDAYGGFFAILHKLEASEGYETDLIDSLRRQPTEFNLEMVARMLRGGVHTVGKIDLKSLLSEVAGDQSKMASARRCASEALRSLQVRSGA